MEAPGTVGRQHVSEEDTHDEERHDGEGRVSEDVADERHSGVLALYTRYSAWVVYLVFRPALQEDARYQAHGYTVEDDRQYNHDHRCHHVADKLATSQVRDDVAEERADPAKPLPGLLDGALGGVYGLLCETGGLTTGGFSLEDKG